MASVRMFLRFVRECMWHNDDGRSGCGCFRTFEKLPPGAPCTQGQIDGRARRVSDAGAMLGRVLDQQARALRAIA
eukprot:966256-Pleurochrysis_carterae.AAC.1